MELFAVSFAMDKAFVIVSENSEAVRWNNA